MIDHDPLDNLLPSLIQCFSVIFLGYLAVRLSMISSQANAIGTYVTKFALPALFFRSMATINFTDVNWMFIIAVSLGKLILFFITVICTFLITRPINFGMIGILSMFITQSNDVALGYPILLSLYPDLANYVYLFAPAQLVFINPLCFILLECHEYRSETSDVTYVSPKRRVLLVLKNVILNPLVFMTVIGVVFNLILSHTLPIYLDKILQILADSFGGVALFYLGMNMVGKISNINKNGIYLLVFLLIGKLIFLPFLTRELVVQLLNLQSPSNQSLNYSLVAFLYGGLPTAPPVFLIANNFQVLPDLIATGLVLGTFISGPLMFISARVITMVVASKSQFDSILKSTAVSVSFISLLGCIWVLMIFLLSKRFKSPIHKLTIGYTFYVILTCSGVVVGRVFLPEMTRSFINQEVKINQTDQNPSWSHYFQFSIFFIGCVGTRLWTVMIAAAMIIIKRNTIFSLIRSITYFYIVGLCVPIIVTAALLLFSQRPTIRDIDPSFQYGRAQLVTSLIILVCSIVSTIILLILEARPGSANEKLINSNESSSSLADGRISTERRVSRTTAHAYTRIIHEEEELRIEIDEKDEDDFQINRHLALTISLVVTMGFGLFLCLWRLINEDISGVYVELEFLDCVFNFGQGFILWTIFGLDTKIIVIPFKTKILKFLENIQEFYIPLETDLSFEVLRIRKQFFKYHLENCRQDIVKDIRFMFTVHSNVFSGKNLIDWMVKIGLTNNRIDALSYGQMLLISRVIEHIKQNRNLIDNEESLYRFTHLADRHHMRLDEHGYTDLDNNCQD